MCGGRRRRPAAEGAGCAVEEEARTVAGKRALAVEAFARALRQIPTILADNAGYDSSDLVTRLRAAHYDGKADYGLGESIHILGKAHADCENQT